VKIRSYVWPKQVRDIGSPVDTLLTIVPKRVSLLVEGRNAWHSTWSRRYDIKAAMFSDHASACQEAETRRKQGSVFYVFDVPALLLFGLYTSCVVTDFHETNSFRGFLGFRKPTHHPVFGWRGIAPGVDMRTAVASIGTDRSLWDGRRDRPSEHSFVRGSVEAGPALSTPSTSPGTIRDRRRARRAATVSHRQRCTASAESRPDRATRHQGGA
jgi:hypothetical protein